MTESPWAWKPIRYEDRCAAQSAYLTAQLASLVAYCAATPNVVRAIVFGSFARGQVTPWSDVDVLVVRDGADVPPLVVDDFYRNGVGIGDVIGIRAEHFPERLAETPLGRSILREGIEVYARPDR